MHIPLLHYSTLPYVSIVVHVTYVFNPDSQGGLPTYVSAPGIVQQISGLHSDLLSLQSDLENSLPEDRNRCINEL